MDTLRSDFSPLAPGNRRVGPNSNTGQKSTLSSPIIDWCTVVIDRSAGIAWCRGKALTEIVREVFGCGSGIVVGAIQDRPLNFYQRSATMVDSTGTVAGKIAVRDDGALQLILNGQGCQHVHDWPAVADFLDTLQARISRCDIAVDDLTGETFDLNLFRDLHSEGAFSSNGRPPVSYTHLTLPTNREV